MRSLDHLLSTVEQDLEGGTRSDGRQWPSSASSIGSAAGYCFRPIADIAIDRTAPKTGTMRLHLIAVFSAVVLALAPQAGCARSDSQQLSLEAQHPFIVAENELENALLAFARSPTRATEASLGRALLQSTVYIRVESPHVMQGADQASTQRINVGSVTLPDGRGALAIYTSKSRFAAAFAEEERANYVGLSGRSALELAAGNQPVAINWGVDPHVHWNAELTERFLTMP